MVVHRGVHRAHDLARRLLAMHARHRLEREARVLRRPGVIAVDAQPVHDPAAFSTCSLPTTGMLFSAWQAITQAWQPMQELRSIAIPQAFSG